MRALDPPERVDAIGISRKDRDLQAGGVGEQAALFVRLGATLVLNLNLALASLAALGPPRIRIRRLAG